MTSQVHVAEGVFVERADGPHLLGSRCNDCGTHAFPPQSGCQRCAGTNTDKVELGNRGTLWTFTVQGFPPKAPPFKGSADPASFVPFGVGYVEIPGQVKVETRLTESDPAKLIIGMQMEMVLVPLCVDADGNEVVTFAFKPVS